MDEFTQTQIINQKEQVNEVQEEDPASIFQVTCLVERLELFIF